MLTLSLFLSRSVVFECRLFTYASHDVGDGVDGGGPNGGDAGRRDCCSASGYSRDVRDGDCHFVHPSPGRQRRKSSRVRALWLFLVSCVSFGNLGHGLVTRGLTKNSKGQNEIDRAFVRVTTLRRSSLIGQQENKTVRAARSVRTRMSALLNARHHGWATAPIFASGMSGFSALLAATRSIASITASGRVNGIW